MRRRVRVNTAERGFIFPLAVVLVVILTISGTGFHHLDYLERRMTMNSVDNHSAFYIASGGLERARETYKISDAFSWTDLLVGGDARYPREHGGSPNYDARLCPDLSKGCAMARFQAPTGDPVTGDMPFEAAFGGSDTSYSVRAFNNDEDPVLCGPPTTDCDQLLIVRALAKDHHEEKLLEVMVKGISGLDLINCQGHQGDPCPTAVIDGIAAQDAAESRHASPHPQLPSIDYSYYRFDLNPGHYTVPGPPLAVLTCASGIDCSSSYITLDVADHTFYLIDRTDAVVTVHSAGNRDRVVIYGNVQGIQLEAQHDLTNTIVMNTFPGAPGSPSEIELRDGTIRAPLPYPAIVSAGDVTHGNPTVTIYGTVMAAGNINANPITVHGVLIGATVETHGSSTYSDDHLSDPNYLKYYAFMPGVTYPDELKSAVVQPGTWKEID